MPPSPTESPHKACYRSEGKAGAPPFLQVKAPVKRESGEVGSGGGGGEGVLDPSESHFLKPLPL